jgi:hypothetical protein
VDEVERALRQEYVDAFNRHDAYEQQLKRFELSLVGAAAPGQPLPRVIFSQAVVEKWQELQRDRDAALRRRRQAEGRYLGYTRRIAKPKGPRRHELCLK